MTSGVSWHMSSQSKGYVFGWDYFFASGNARFPRLHLFAKFRSDTLVAVGCRIRLGRDGKGGGALFARSASGRR